MQESEAKTTHYAVCNDPSHAAAGGWFGPTRETFDLAQTDAAEHNQATGHSASVI